MSAFDDQNEEMEVLNSIYPTEIEIISTNPHKFKISICPNPGGDDNHVTATLVCEFPADYPNTVAPILEVVVTKGLSLDRGDELLLVAQNAANENIGLPSIFTIAELVKEWLVDNNIPGQDGSMYSDMLRREQMKEVESKKQQAKAERKDLADNEFKDLSIDPEELERIRKRQAGTQVTVESFQKWKAAFDEEMRLATESAAAKAGITQAQQQLLAQGGSEDRPTGKALFLANKVAADDADVEALIAAGESEEMMSSAGNSAKGSTNADWEEGDDEDDDEDYIDEADLEEVFSDEDEEGQEER